MCVSSIIVVLNAKLSRLVAARVDKQDVEKRRSPTKGPFSLVETHEHWTSIAVLTVHAESSLLFYYMLFNDLCKLIEIQIYGRKKHPFTSYPAEKHPKMEQICYYRHATKTSGLFLLYDTGVGFNSRDNFANLDFFAKVSVPLQFIIP